MATKIVSTDVVGNVKPSFASSSLVGLTVRANGEETTKVLDMNGNMVDAQFPAPTVAPTLSNTATTADQTYNDAVTPGKDVTVADGITDGSTLVESATAAFSLADVGQPLTLTKTPTSTVGVVGSYVDATHVHADFPFAANTGVTVTVGGRPDKVVRSATAKFTAADVGAAIKVNGVDDVIAAYNSSEEIVATTHDFATFPAQTLVISGRAAIANKWVAYVYVYAATQRYPFVENDQSIGGSVAPRGMPSPIATLQLSEDAYSAHLVATAPPVTRPDLDQVWFFRTVMFDTEEEAHLNAEAGNLYFVAGVDATAGGADVTYDDTNPLEGTDQIEVDNFGVPTFRYVVYCDPYWYGWGNFPLSVVGSWATTGIITLTDGTKWYDGRNGQYVKLEGIEEGGIGDNGLWLFKRIDATHAQLTNGDGTNSTLAASGSGQIVIQGPPTTLYRSKPRNPFSWGFTEILASGSRVPQVYAFKIGGGLGTAIAQIPTVPYLLLSTEYPAGAYTLDLRNAGSTSFEITLRQISNFYSISSHFSQFTATRSFAPANAAPLRSEKVVLWGWDAKNFAIVECDGLGINLVSEKISKTLRRMSPIRSKQLLAHGAYDARNRMNCMWLPSDSNLSQVDLLIMHHAQTDQWFVKDEHDVLCSAQFQDGDTNLSKIYIGTETGLMGEAFADGFFADWVSSGRSYGTCTVATDNSLTRDDGVDFYLDRDGYVGNWCLVTDLNGENEQWARISAVSAHTLTFDYIKPAIGTDTTAFNPPLVAGTIFYVGVIECRALKYFNMQAPAEDKRLQEVWATIDGVDIARMEGHTGSTFLRFYRERRSEPFAPQTDGRINIPFTRVKMDDDAGTHVWFTQTPPTEPIKAFGLEIIDRGFERWRFYDWTLKAV